MELLILLGLFAAVFLYCMIRGTLDEKKRKKAYEEKLRSEYGQIVCREYTPEQMKTIARLYNKKLQDNCDGYCIDDITWNDLNMDGIFEMIDRTQSSSGAEYLYDMLRRPRLSPEGMETLEKDIRYLTENEEERVRLQMKLHELGTTGRFSLHDYLDFMDNLGKRSNVGHIAGIIAIALSVASMGISGTFGISALIAVACFNIITYLKEKSVATPYLTSFSYIMRMLGCAEQILNEPLTQMKEYRMSLSEKVKKLAPMHRGSTLVFKMNSSSGDPFEIVFDYIKMITHIDIIQFNKMVKLVRSHTEDIVAMTQDIGYLDTVIAIGCFRCGLPFWCEPKLESGMETGFSIQEGYHPLIKEPVANSFSQKRGMLITGSNASGKSTFLKMTAINAILAQTIHTCAAREYSGGCYRIYSSMALRDDLESGESYYIVEIKALKRIIDAAGNADSSPLLCFVDEVLRGTNTVERIAASTQIMRQLAGKGIYCFAATHDIELTHLLEESYDNYHFEEEVKDGDVLFSYHLLTGRAQTRNAIKLLEVIGFSKAITAEAQIMAEHFITTGNWQQEGV